MRVFNKIMDFIEYYAIEKNDEVLLFVIAWMTFGIVANILCKLIISI